MTSGAKQPALHSILWVLMVYCVIIPAAFTAQRFSPARGDYPLLAEVILWHVVLCFAVCVLLKLTAQLLMLRSNENQVVMAIYSFLRPFAVWPFIGCMVMAALKLLGIA